MLIYSKSAGLNNAAIGKLETPIKMLIEHESDLLSKQEGACNLLFNVEKSNRFGETIIGHSEFDVFRAVDEGNAAETDTISETYRKFIEHIQFMKEFVITAEMMEDANYGVAADAKRRAQNFTRAYYKTMHKICEYALANGTSTSGSFAGASIDLSAPDGKALFSNAHTYGSDTSNVQSNYFWGNLLNTGDSTRTPNATVFEVALYNLATRLRNMKDENGEVLGYEADTIILPGNKPLLESVAKSVCGSPMSTYGTGNSINLNYSHWNIVVLPTWQTTDNRIMVMSSEANKNLSGNMFFNRVPLTISNWVDHHTGNYIWNGRCRFGVGFGNYKHILMAVDSASSVANADPFDLFA